MTTVVQTLNTDAVAPSAPVARPTPVDRDEYTSTNCPLCFKSLDQRVRGLFCPRCKGWLVEELHEGQLVHTLWQGRP